MIQPPYLCAGDTIGIVATGKKVTSGDIEQSFAVFKRWGLTLRLSRHLYSTAHPYLAGVDNERLPDLQAMLDDPTIKAIICARGGYGTARILDQLDFSAFRKNPKWIVGFSDITALHQSLLTRGYQSIHGAMPILFAGPNAEPSIESLRLALFGESQIISAPANPFNKPGQAMGRIMGGNLSLLASVLGTADEPDTTAGILVIEEIDEYWYKVDRMIVQLKRAGKFEKLAGLIIGYFTGIKDDTSVGFGEKIEHIVLHHTRDYTFPVAFNFPTGHENPNFSWKHGRTMRLDVTDLGSSLREISEQG